MVNIHTKEDEFIFNLLNDNKILNDETSTFTTSFSDVLDSNIQKFGIGKAIEQTIATFTTNIKSIETGLIRNFILSELKEIKPELQKEIQEFYSKIEIANNHGIVTCDDAVKYCMNTNTS